MNSAVSKLKTGRIAVIGDVMLDRYWFGTANRISPEAPVPVLRVSGQEDRIGGAANVAANAVAVGTQTTLAGLIGEDADGQAIEMRCRAAGITPMLLRNAAPSTVKLRALAQHQQLLRIDFEAPPAADAAARLLADAGRVFAGAGAIVLSDYAKGALERPQAWIDKARAAGIPVIVDPKHQDFGRYAGADLLTPNLGEFHAAVGTCADESTLVERALSLCRQHGFGGLLVTRGEHGMSLVRPGFAPLHLPAQARDVFDVTGAGDTVCALLACGLAAGLDWPTATALANIAAGIVVGKLGTAVVSNEELANAVRPSVGAVSKGVLTEAQLLTEVAMARSRGQRIVMTNGCFDLLHVGHLRYLEAAAALGDRLIVAVNTDASVKRLKGPARPVNSTVTRMEVLAGLRAVDWVTAFDEDTPQRLIAAVGPDVLVKGGDYRVDQIAGGADVLARGGRVLTLPFHEGHSTTALLAALTQLGDPA